MSRSRLVRAKSLVLNEFCELVPKGRALRQNLLMAETSSTPNAQLTNSQNALLGNWELDFWELIRAKRVTVPALVASAAWRWEAVP